MTFTDPHYLVLIVMLLPILWLGNRRRQTLGHSQVGIHTHMSSRSSFRHVNSLLICLLWTSACVALARPVLPQVLQRQAIQTRDIVVQVDISGSMADPIEGDRPSIFTPPPSAATPSSTSPSVTTRIAAARVAVTDFVNEREGDRVALLVFNDESFYGWPLSRDRDVVVRRVEQIERYVGGGTNFDGQNGAVQGAIDHFREMSEAATRVLILVTDGEASMERERTLALARQLAELHIRVYVLGVGPGWINNSLLTRDLRRLVESVGGTVIPVGNDAQMRAAFAEISRLERSTIYVERSITYLEIYGLLAALAVLLLLAYQAVSALILEDA